MNFGSLFAGIGGFDLALERAGMTCAWQVDNDDKCQQVLGHHWPDVTRYGDVRNVGKRNLETVDLLVGGFPCQDLSVAGKRQGLAGERSGLWFEFARVIGELKPRWVIVENVPGLLSSGEKRDMGILLGQLAKFGYMGAYRVFDAQFFGVAQRRRRMFVVGSLGDGRAVEVLFERQGSAWHPAPGREAGEKPAYALAASVRGTGDGHGQGWNTTYVTGFDRTRGTASGDVSAPLRACRAATEGVSDGKANAQCVAFQSKASAHNSMNPSSIAPSLGVGKSGGVAALTQYGVRCLTPTEAERLQGFPDGWTAVDGMSDTARYRMLGNAVAVPVVEWIGRRIASLSL